MSQVQPEPEEIEEEAVFSMPCVWFFVGSSHFGPFDPWLHDTQ